MLWLCTSLKHYIILTYAFMCAQAAKGHQTLLADLNRSRKKWKELLESQEYFKFDQKEDFVHQRFLRCMVGMQQLGDEHQVGVRGGGVLQRIAENLWPPKSLASHAIAARFAVEPMSGQRLRCKFHTDAAHKHHYPSHHDFAVQVSAKGCLDEPLKKYVRMFHGVNEEVRRHEKAAADLEKARERVDKLAFGDPAKKDKAERALNDAEAKWQAVNDSLPPELPQVHDSRWDFFDPMVDGLVEGEARYVGTSGAWLYLCADVCTSAGHYYRRADSFLSPPLLSLRTSICCCAP